MFPGRVILGIGTGESLNEVPSTGQPWPEFKERFAPAARGRDADPHPVARGARELRGASTIAPTRPRSTTAPRPRCPIYVAAVGRARRPLCGALGRRLHLHQRQEVGALHRDAVAQGQRGAGGGRRAQAAVRLHDGNEGLLRHRPRARPAGYAPLGGAGADPGREDVGRGSGRDAAAGRCLAAGTSRQSLASLQRSRRGRRSASAAMSGSASGTSSSTLRDRTRHGS